MSTTKPTTPVIIRDKATGEIMQRMQVPTQEADRAIAQALVVIRNRGVDAEVVIDRGLERHR